MTSARARGRPGGRPAAPADPIAEPLHRAALQLLRLVRREDAASGLSPARLSALSVLVFGGPSTLGALAAAEQVSAPTMSRLVAELEREGWIARRADPADARATRLVASPAAHRLLLAGRDRRLQAISRGLAALSATDRRSIAAAIPALERLVQATRAVGVETGAPDTRAAPRGAPQGARRGVAPRSGRRRFD